MSPLWGAFIFSELCADVPPPSTKWHESHLTVMKVSFKNFSSISLKTFSLVAATPAYFLMRFANVAPVSLEHRQAKQPTSQQLALVVGVSSPPTIQRWTPGAAVGVPCSPSGLCQACTVGLRRGEAGLCFQVPCGTGFSHRTGTGGDEI